MNISRHYSFVDEFFSAYSDRNYSEPYPSDCTLDTKGLNPDFTFVTLIIFVFFPCSLHLAFLSFNSGLSRIFS